MPSSSSKTNKPFIFPSDDDVDSDEDYRTNHEASDSETVTDIMDEHSDMEDDEKKNKKKKKKNEFCIWENYMSTNFQENIF